jgi:hypothetical protein
LPPRCAFRQPHMPTVLCARKMKINKTHHIGKSEPDENGMYDFYYDYQIYEFSEGKIMLVARSYKGDNEAHFLRKEIDGEKAFINQTDLESPLLSSAVEYLKNEGIETVSYLGQKGYVHV